MSRLVKDFSRRPAFGEAYGGDKTASGEGSTSELGFRRGPASDFHTIIPINDHPQAARWRVTNKEIMGALMTATGASVTLKGHFYAAGETPPAGAPPKLHLLVESDEDFKVEQAAREIKRILIDASSATLRAEVRTSQTGNFSGIAAPRL